MIQVITNSSTETKIKHVQNNASGSSDFDPGQSREQMSCDLGAGILRASKFGT